MADASFTAFLPAKRSSPEELEASLIILKANRAMMGTDELVVTAERIGSLSSRIIEEITSQGQLIAAESNELVARPESLHSLELLRSVLATYQCSDVLAGRLLCIAQDAADLAFESDRSLLGRVVGNMTKNAIEATPAGQTITLGCRLEQGRVTFWVNNPTYMPEKVQRQGKHVQ